MDMYIVFSPDHDGWYTEIYSRVTGEELHVTDVYGTRDEARRAGLAWCKSHSLGGALNSHTVTIVSVLETLTQEQPQ